MSDTEATDAAEILLTRAEAQARAGISSARMYQLAREGRFPKPVSLGAVRSNGVPALTRYRAADIDHWRETRTVRAVDEDSVFQDPAPGAAFVKGPSFGRAPDAVAFARTLGWHVYASLTERAFVVWTASRGAERDARIVEILKRQRPGFAFSVKGAE